MKRVAYRFVHVYNHKMKKMTVDTSITKRKKLKPVTMENPQTPKTSKEEMKRTTTEHPKAKNQASPSLTTVSLCLLMATLD